MKSKYILMFLCLSMAFGSCELSELNVDPNRSPSARPQEVLTSALGYTTWVIDGRYNQLAFQWGQYWTWGPGVSLGNSARYVAEPDDHNNLWARAYSNALADIKFLINTDDPAYSAVGKVLNAYIYQGLVDHFNDVPFTAAINGAIEDGSDVAPVYDDAASIYAGLVVQLDEAIAALETAPATIGAEDLMYGGDLSYWSTFAKSLQLRILMRQSGVVDVAAAVQNLIQEGDLIHNTSDMASIAFNGAAGDENPMFAVRESGIGNFYIASNSSLDVLRELNDPRISALYDDAVNFPGEIIGVHHGGIDLEGFTVVREDYSQGSAATYGAAVPVIFISDWEMWFLRAEAAARFGTADDEATAFANGVAASFNNLQVGGVDAYVSSLGYNTGATLNERIRHIAIQKWIACNGFQEDEGWIESRRFDTPDNPIFTDNASGIYRTPSFSALADGVHPSAFLYPQSEQSLNINAPNQRLITDKVFWDN